MLKSQSSLEKARLTSQPRLPEFTRPPLVEAVLTVQFEKVERLKSVHAGLFWSRLRDAFPRFEHVEEHPPIEQAIELPSPGGYRPPGIRVEVVDTPGLPRLFFLTHDKTELIQLQPDRLSHNWRKLGKQDQYPRYERIRPIFQQELQLFEGFLADEKLGALAPAQCEIVYINHIFSAEDRASPLRPGDILKPWPHDYRGLAGTEMEDLSLNVRHLIHGPDGKFLGRLFVSMKPALRKSDGTPLHVLELVARGKPLRPGLEGALEFIDKGRELLCLAFAEITTKEMHKVWGRQNGD